MRIFSTAFSLLLAPPKTSGWKLFNWLLSFAMMIFGFGNSFCQSLPFKKKFEISKEIPQTKKYGKLANTFGKPFTKLSSNFHKNKLKNGNRKKKHLFLTLFYSWLIAKQFSLVSVTISEHGSLPLDHWLSSDFRWQNRAPFKPFVDMTFFI